MCANKREKDVPNRREQMLPDEETISRLAHIRQVISQTASLMPVQRDYLQRQESASNLGLHAS
jgi:hypothetical protein